MPCTAWLKHFVIQNGDSGICLQASILSTLTGYLLDVRSVRQEIDRREMCGQFVAGRKGEGGAFAMRSLEERAKRAAAANADEANTEASPQNNPAILTSY
jgi:hypothetical protein